MASLGKSYPAKFTCPECGQQFDFEGRVEQDIFKRAIIVINAGMVRRIVLMHYERHHPECIDALTENWE